MRIRRRRKNFLPLFMALLVVIAVFALVYYTMSTSLKNSPIYSADKVLYIIKRDASVAFVLVNSNEESVKVLYTEANLYDPETGKQLNQDPIEDYAFFKDVFETGTTQWRYLDLGGNEFSKFSKELTGKETRSIGDLLRALKKRGGFFDIFVVGKVVKSLSEKSNLDNSALLKLLDSLRKYDLDERTVRGITKNPIKVKIEGDGEYERIYIDSREKEGIREFLGIKG